jgi:predicted RNA-binding protein YlqC (UPF0109 family)
MTGDDNDILDDEVELELEDEAEGTFVDGQPAEDATESLRELVSFIVSNLVDNPDEAEVTAERRGSSVYIQVRLPEDDLGKVIGRGGRIAKAIRTVLLVAGSRHHLRVSLDIES